MAGSGLCKGYEGRAVVAGGSGGGGGGEGVWKGGGLHVGTGGLGGGGGGERPGWVTWGSS